VTTQQPAAGSRFGPFRHRAYVVYWLAVAISSLGTWLAAVAGSIYVYDLTGSTFSVGVFNFAGFVPILIFSVWGGQISDRFDRRTVVWTTHAASVAIAAVLAWVTITGTATELVLIATVFLLNMLWALGKPSLMSLIPNIVPREDLQDSVALASLAFMTGQIAGPLIAAGALAISGPGLAFAINALSYVAPIVAMFVLARMGLAGRETAIVRKAALAAAGSGVTFVRKNTWVAGLLAGVVVTSMAMEIQRTVAPALASKQLGVAESNAALLLAFQSMGAAVSFLLFIPIRKSGRLRESAFVGLVLQGAGVVIGALATVFPIALAGFFLIGLGFALCMPVLTAALQEATPDNLRGRIMSYHQMALLGHRPITALIIGTVAAVSLQGGMLIWLLVLPLGLFAVRSAWRRLPVQPPPPPAARSGVAADAVGVPLPEG
jgi:MFS family permease